MSHETHDSTKIKMKQTTIITPTFEIIYIYIYIFFYKKMNILKYIKIQEANYNQKKKTYHEYDISMTGDLNL